MPMRSCKGREGKGHSTSSEISYSSFHGTGRDYSVLFPPVWSRWITIGLVRDACVADSLGATERPIVRRGCLLGLVWFHSVLVLKFAVVIT